MPLQYFPDMENLPPPAVRDFEPFVSLSEDELEQLVEQYGLSPRQRAVVYCRAICGLTISETARQLCISRRAVRTHLARVSRKISPGV